MLPLNKPGEKPVSRPRQDEPCTVVVGILLLSLSSGCAETAPLVAQPGPGGPPKIGEPSTSPAVTPTSEQRKRAEPSERPDGTTVPASERQPASPTPPDSSPPTTPPSGAGNSGGYQFQNYTILPNDTLSGIAACFGLSIDVIKELNPNIRSNPNLIYPNNVLLIPGNATNHCSRAEAPANEPDGACQYLVKPGDYLERIARFYKTTVPILRTMNHLQSDTIYSGVSIKVPCMKPNQRVSQPDIVDLCPNLPGDQETIPNGFIKNSRGDCVALPPPPAPDLCPNLSGRQETLPAGLIRNDKGDCVRPPPPPPPPPVYVACDTTIRSDVTSEQRRVLFSSGDAVLLLEKYLRDIKRKNIRVNLEDLTIILFVQNNGKAEQVSLTAPRLTTWQRATGKHEQAWIKKLQEKRAERLENPIVTANQLKADLVCGD